MSKTKFRPLLWLAYAIIACVCAFFVWLLWPLVIPLAVIMWAIYYVWTNDAEARRNRGESD